MADRAEDLLEPGDALGHRAIELADLERVPLHRVPLGGEPGRARALEGGAEADGATDRAFAADDRRDEFLGDSVLQGADDRVLVDVLGQRPQGVLGENLVGKQQDDVVPALDVVGVDGHDWNGPLQRTDDRRDAPV